jgi:hypothetical protein
MWLLITSLFAQFSGGTGMSPVPPFYFQVSYDNFSSKGRYRWQRLAIALMSMSRW